MPVRRDVCRNTSGGVTVAEILQTPRTGSVADKEDAYNELLAVTEMETRLHVATGARLPSTVLIRAQTQ